MKITEIEIPKDYHLTDGLCDIKMSRLNQIVLIAGQNGSGKSRLLKKISGLFTKKTTPKQLQESLDQLPSFEEALQNNKNLLKKFDDENYQPQLNEVQRQSKIDKIQRQIEKYKNNHIPNSLKYINWNYITTDVDSEKYSTLEFVPKQITLSDPSSLSKTNLLNNAMSAHNLGVANLRESALAKIQNVQDRWFNATHQNTMQESKEIESCIKEYEDLKTNIKIFLNAELSRDSDDQATLFNFPLGKANLSDGQKVLLQLCIAIHSQGSQLNELILMMDEPENHLHPGAIIEVLNILKEKIPNGQIWIATHSISIIAHFYDSNNLWFMNEGQVKFAGKIPEQVIQSLVGSKDGVEKIHSFLDQPAQLAAARYAYECLCPPLTVMTETGDPQVNQIRNTIQNLYEQKGAIKLLDFGAGKGRLIANLNDYDQKENLPDKINYVALDCSLDDKDACLNSIEKVYGNTDKRHYLSYDSVLEEHHKKSFNLIVLCNVFHEIHPDSWLEIVKQIDDLLENEGFLLIVEDQRIPIGEKAYKEGFIVLDTTSQKDLFKIEGDCTDFLLDSTKQGRLKAHLISKSLLCNITSATIDTALKSCRDQAKREIKHLRSIEASYSNGQLHAFWTQQFANTSLVIND